MPVVLLIMETICSDVVAYVTVVGKSQAPLSGTVIVTPGKTVEPVPVQSDATAIAAVVPPVGES